MTSEPVCLSTWLSMKLIVPRTDVRLPPGTTISAMALEASARLTAASSPCGTAKLTRIGLV